MLQVFFYFFLIMFDKYLPSIMGIFLKKPQQGATLCLQEAYTY
jgi:hypothetical protein